MKRHLSRSLALVIALSPVVASADDWTRFRGPGGNGVSKEKGLPHTWSSEENIAWKLPLPGPGASSPITFGDRIYLTCYSGFGLSQDSPGDQSNLKRHLVCLDRDSGQIPWDTPTASRAGVQPYRSYVGLHGYASSTPVCDGERIYCFYGSSGAYAFDMNGKKLWDVELGKGTNGFGTGSSPVLVGDLLIVNASVESRTLRGLDKKTGGEVWQARGVDDSWGSPVVVDTGSRKEIIIDMKTHVKAFDARSGNELWQCQGSTPPRYICPTPIVHGGMIYAIHGYSGPMSAIKPGGSGDVTNSHRQWTRPKVISNVPSPVFSGGYIFSVRSEGGIVSCVDAKDGSIIYQKRLQKKDGGGINRLYASPLAADGKIYFVSREEGAFVLEAGPEFKQLAHNQIADDRSIFNGSPVVSNGRLLLRSDKFLYCIGQK